MDKLYHLLKSKIYSKFIVDKIFGYLRLDNYLCNNFKELLFSEIIFVINKYTEKGGILSEVALIHLSLSHKKYEVCRLLIEYYKIPFSEYYYLLCKYSNVKFLSYFREKFCDIIYDMIESPCPLVLTLEYNNFENFKYLVSNIEFDPTYIFVETILGEKRKYLKELLKYHSINKTIIDTVSPLLRKNFLKIIDLFPKHLFTIENLEDACGRSTSLAIYYLNIGIKPSKKCLVIAHKMKKKILYEKIKNMVE